jgi:hypothetical protein
VFGDGTVMIFEADNEVGKRDRLPASSDPASFVNGAALFKCVEGHDVGGELVLGDRDSPSSGGASVSDEAGEGEVFSRSCH